MSFIPECVKEIVCWKSQIIYFDIILALLFFVGIIIAVGIWWIIIESKMEEK